ncbi:shikimate dehydrogenase [Clostridium sp. DJ247]|uniref:shikimate dehydrogenase n=1 Tax=Clostridium sp. DJ247 TaxID=2726188 RepID=UPI0016238F5B|nr:shikimate dehydrogenase [Clostridium sp. DJ247]MBC2582011.1 shikimate dehydrogenase [Clostridium sp. DJ247]
MRGFYGLIGEKLGHSLSPQIHNKFFRKTNSEGSYNLFEIKRENLKQAVEGLKALGAKGVNVTIPYKIDIIQYLDKLSPEAEKIGAINTIAFNNGTVTGYNTDYYGFGASLRKANVNIENKNAVLLGTGGVSKAVVQYLIDNKINDIIYVSRNPESVEDIKEFKIISYDDMEGLGNSDIIINCTPCGMYPKVEDSPVSKDILSKFSTAVDLIYNPEETVFLKHAKELKLNTVNGLYMLVAQAIAAQEIWQEVKIKDEIVESIYEELR